MGLTTVRKKLRFDIIKKIMEINGLIYLKITIIDKEISGNAVKYKKLYTVVPN